MAEAIVGPLLSKLQEVAVKEAKALAAVGGEIDKLRDKLMWLQALVHEADLRGRLDGSRLVRVLAFQIRDAGFEVEDAVDKFYLRGSLYRRFGGSYLRITKEFILNMPKHVFVCFVLSRRIRSINVRLEEIIGNKNTYTLSQSSSGDGQSWRASRAIPPMREGWDMDYSKEFVLKYPREAAKKLVNQIEVANDVSQVITVVGVEGVGKTALLRHAYKKPSVKNVFKGRRIWWSFPLDISDDSMIQQIKKALGKLGEELTGSRCLIVIDSPVSTMTGRKVGNQILEMVGAGSKIVLSVASSWREEKNKKKNKKEGTITRDESNRGRHVTINLVRMTKDYSQRLFNHVYGLGGLRGTDYEVAEMNYIRSFLPEITNGIPLSVVLVAKLMRTMDFGKWKAAADYLKCNIEDNKTKTILSVCIDDLSDELKSCLLYTAGFPENRRIDANQLVRLWMAEGFLTQQHKLETEQLGQCYLKELIYRGLLELIQKTSAHGGYVQWVAIPKQIHPLLRSEAQRTGFMAVHYGGSIPPPGNTRRLALHDYNDKFPALDHSLDKLRTVVSFSDDYTDYPHGEWTNQVAREHGITILGGWNNQASREHGTTNLGAWNNRAACEHGITILGRQKAEPSHDEPRLRIRKFLQGSPYLRVINLEGIEVLKGKKKDHQVCALPRKIGEMVHLRYLGIRCRNLKKVPSSIGNLCNLQTIDVRGTGVRKLPESLWKAKTLRHVLGKELAFPISSTATGEDLKLMNTLESVTIDHRQEVHQLVKTQQGAKKMLRLQFLHRLHVAKLTAGHGKALASVIGALAKRSLETLILSGAQIPLDDLFAGASSEATAAARMEDVEFLKLDGKPQLADYQRLGSCLVNLTHLVLRSTKIGQEFVHWIGELPVLAELELLEDSYEDGQLIFCTHGFNSLTMLRISSLDKPEQLVLPDASTRWKKDINIYDVQVNVMPDKHCRYCPRPKEQQPIAGGTAGGVQQAEATTTTNAMDGNPQSTISLSQDARAQRDGQDGEARMATPATDGNQQDNNLESHKDTALLVKTKKDTALLTEMIRFAVYNNKNSKTTIINYIKEEYLGKWLDSMVKSGELTREKHNGNNKYYIARGSLQGSAKGTEKPFIEMILEAVNNHCSSKTTIGGYIKQRYLNICLHHMVESGELRSGDPDNGRRNKYYISRGLSANEALEHNAVASSTVSQQD